MNNENLFHGEQASAEKIERLNRLQALCSFIQAINPTIRISGIDFDENSKNATVMLDFPEVFFCNDERVRKSIATLFFECDDVFIAAPDQRVRMTFGLRNMWDKYEDETE